jgi:hypothetical protein
MMRRGSSRSASMKLRPECVCSRPRLQLGEESDRPDLKVWQQAIRLLIENYDGAFTYLKWFEYVAEQVPRDRGEPPCSRAGYTTARPCKLYFQRSKTRWSCRFCCRHCSLSAVQKGFSLP